MKRIVIAGALIVAAGTASAAQLSEVEGKAFVSKGAGFAPVTAGFSLVVGDRVMVSRESSARISFADGCSISVLPGEVVSIGKISPCAGGDAAKSISFAGRMGQSSSDAEGVTNPTLLIIGGTAIVGGAIAFFATQGDDKKSKSP